MFRRCMHYCHFDCFENARVHSHVRYGLTTEICRPCFFLSGMFFLLGCLVKKEYILFLIVTSSLFVENA
jgi:hypothetical protein